MKKMLSIPLLAVVLVTSGCFKLASDSTVSNDGSATMKLTMSHKAEILEMMKSQLDQAIEMLGDDNPQIAQARDQFAKVGSAFDEKKVAAEWKSLGLEVTKSAPTDKDGWKGFEMEGSAKSLPDYNKKLDARRAAESKPREGGGGPDPSAFSVPRMPRFYKTDQPNVAKVVMVWRDRSAQDRMFELDDQMSEEQKEQIEMGLDGARMQMGLDDLKIEMKVKLPGKILSVTNCKQEGENVLAFTFSGASLTADSMPQMMKLPSAMLQFDPKEFKIPLEDEPKSESRPASRRTESRKKDEEKDK